MITEDEDTSFKDKFNEIFYKVFWNIELNFKAVSSNYKTVFKNLLLKFKCHLCNKIYLLLP